MKHQATLRVTSGKVPLDRHIKSYIRSYLDETLKRDVGAAIAKRKPAVPRERGIDYLSRHEKGKITVHGFLVDHVIRVSGKHPAQLTQAEIPGILACAVRSAALQSTAKNKTPVRIGNAACAKIAISLSPEMSRALVRNGDDIDAVLIHVTTETFRCYEIGVMDGNSIGFAIGCHHDREHFHAHVLLLLHAADGTSLKLTNNKAAKYLTHLTNTVNAVLAEFVASQTRPILVIGKSTPLAKAFDYLMASAACHLDPKNPDNTLATIRSMPATDIIRILDQANNNLKAGVKKLLDIQPPQSRNELIRDRIDNLNNLLWRMAEAAAADKKAKSSVAQRIAFRATIETCKAALQHQLPDFIEQYVIWRDDKDIEHEKYFTPILRPLRTR